MVAGGAERPERRTGGLTPPRPAALTASAPLLVVLGGAAAQRHAIDAARALGVRTLVCDRDPSLGDLAVSTEDEEGVLRAARGADGILAPGTDWPVRVAARVAERLCLPHPVSAAVAELATDKLAQRERLALAGVPQPPWSERPIAPPCVVKPADRQGQRGLRFVPAGGGVEEAVRAARAASRSGRVVFERWVDAPEVTVNGFSTGGRFRAVAVTDREHFAAARGIARRHVYPARAGAGAAAAVAGGAVAALGIEEGPSYVQLLLAPEGPLVVEVAARLGGGHDSEICRLCAGVDLAALTVRSALGGEIDPEELEPRPNGAGVVEFLAAPPGRLLAALARPPAGACVRFDHRAGHRYGPILCAPDRAGHVVALGCEREDALRIAAAAAASVTFVTS